LKLPTETFPSVIQSVTTDWKCPSVVTDWITDEKRSELKKRLVTDMEVLAGLFLLMESPRDSKWQIHMVTCWFFRQNSRRTHRQKIHRWNRQKKLIYVLFADPLLPYFSFFFLIPTLPICKQPAPPPPKQKSPSSQHNKIYFLKFCGHSIRVLIYRRILSIFVSNSIFLNFNI